MAAYERAHIDEIASNQWPHWIPVRHHFGIETFGVNLWRGQDDGTVIPEHDESRSGAPELYYVVEGQATFTVDGDEVDAPAGTCVWVTDPATKRAARAGGPDTLVLSVGAAAPGQAYTPAGWDSHYLAGDK
jgi:quercetin dioxygenase-like cupin family protein